MIITLSNKDRFDDSETSVEMQFAFEEDSTWMEIIEKILYSLQTFGYGYNTTVQKLVDAIEFCNEKNSPFKSIPNFYDKEENNN